MIKTQVLPGVDWFVGSFIILCMTAGAVPWQYAEQDDAIGHCESYLFDFSQDFVLTVFTDLGIENTPAVIFEFYIFAQQALIGVG